MAGDREKSITVRFGKPNYKSQTGSMWYFKHMIYIRKTKNGVMSIKLLRIKKDKFEWFDENDSCWRNTPMQNIPMQKYKEFVDEQLEEILLGDGCV